MYGVKKNHKNALKLVLVIVGLVYLSTAKASQRYEHNPVMRKLWAFSHRQTPEGYMTSQEVLNTLHSQPMQRPATPSEFKDIVKAMARAVLIDPKRVEQEVKSLRSNLSTFVNDKIRAHFASLAEGYASMLDYRSSESPIPGRWALAEKYLSPPTITQIKPGITSDPGFLKAFQEVVTIYQQGYYTTADGMVISLDRVTPAKPIKANKNPKIYLTAPSKTVITFIPKFHEQIVLDLLSGQKDAPSRKKLADKIAILDYANAIVIGGNPRHQGTQEEELVREMPGLYESLCATGSETRSDARETFLNPIIDESYLQLAQKAWSSKIKSTVDAYYIPRVPFIRQRIGVKNETPIYKLFDEPIFVNIIASAAPDLRQGSIDGPGGIPIPQDTPKLEIPKARGKVYFPLLRQKIEAQVQAALDNGHTILLTGLFGCGAFNNDPKIVGRIYAEVLSDEKYKNRFEAVYFACSGEKGTALEKAFKENYKA